ncbi:hypothetical protein [[Phormidium] sp. ETS-05]|uniref:hypothetical protein n=1 Tax=[Phormidium] sp. ETS-05 TaxID=222819 RepID=UPI0018EEDF03|nr:hypothetical protein [[Phormidium] sp. ETS-05]
MYVYSIQNIYSIQTELATHRLAAFTLNNPIIIAQKNFGKAEKVGKGRKKSGVFQKHSPSGR